MFHLCAQIDRAGASLEAVQLRAELDGALRERDEAQRRGDEAAREISELRQQALEVCKVLCVYAHVCVCLCLCV